MKIGILTMQRVKNYGSFFVAYCLKKNLEKLGHEVVFVDYKKEKPVEKSIKDTFVFSIMRKVYHIFRGLFGIKNDMEKKSDDFLKRYDKEFWKKLGLSKCAQYRSKVDLLIIGSDEVFNCTQRGRNVGYSRELFGKNHQAKRLISYAASFGNTTLEKLEKYHIKTEIAQMLKEFNEISVRDKNSYHIVNKLINKKPIFHIDPVFTWDLDEELPKIHKKDYIVVYAYRNRITNEEQVAIKEFAKKHQKELVTLGTVQEFCDTYIPASPFEALAYIKNADYIITDTFHGTIFSAKYNKKFATIIRESNKQKLSDLLERIYMKKREVTDISKLEQILTQEIDYEKTNAFIKEQTAKSIKYLEDNIKKVKKEN